MRVARAISSRRARVRATVTDRATVRGGVEQPERRLGPQAQLGSVARRVQSGEHVDPQVDVAALQAADRLPVLLREGAEVAVLHADDVRVAQCEVDMEPDERAQGLGVVVRRGDDRPAALEKALADPDEQGCEHRLLAREVAVDGRSADADRCTEVLDRDAVEAVVREQPRSLGQQRAAALGLGAHAGRRRCQLVGHRLLLPARVGAVRAFSWTTA